VGGGVQLGPLCIAATNRPILQTPCDYDDREIGGIMIDRGNRSTHRKPAPSADLSTTNPTCCPDAASCRRCGKRATNRLGFKPGSAHVGFCNGQKWPWGRFSLRTSVFPTKLHSICFSTIIFTITRSWHNRPGVAAVPMASRTKLEKTAWVTAEPCFQAF
jgi:hypothetical protein